MITREQQQRIKQNQTVEPFNLHLFSQKPQRNCGIILMIILILSGAVDNINIKQEPSSNQLINHKSVTKIYNNRDQYQMLLAVRLQRSC